MEKLKISAKEFDSIVPADDLCMAIGLVFSSQRRALRHYLLPDGQELTVNTARNEWAMKNPDCYGTASQLAEKLGLTALTEGDNFCKAFSLVENLYAKREKAYGLFHAANLSVPLSGFTEIQGSENSELSVRMTQVGLSQKTLGRYAVSGWIPKVKGTGSDEVLAFPVRESGLFGFTGQSYRQIGDAGMTTFSTRRKDQICMVYENPLDFLALMEQVERNGVHAVMSRRYHIILNYYCPLNHKESSPTS